MSRRKHARGVFVPHLFFVRKRESPQPSVRLRTLPRFTLFSLAILLFAGCAFAAPATVRGRVLDITGAPVPNARVLLRVPGSSTVLSATSNEDGEFTFQTEAGTFTVSAAATGFADAVRTLRIPAAGVAIDLILRPAALNMTMEVIATRIASTSDGLDRLPGSLSTLTATDLNQSHPLTTDEALRKLPGIYTRAEEGFGLRPNIGVRGLNPTRSSQMLLLEDGLPLAFAPYGDNASYYHPPIDRFDSLEVVKGGGQILYGPRTVGAVINYLTPPPPDNWSGSLAMSGGNRNYANAHLRFGGPVGGTGILVDILRKQGHGARQNLRHGLTDFNVKTLTSVTPRQTLSVRFNAYGEDSQVTYSGLRESEYAADARANPFSNDDFSGRRYASSVRHTWAPRETLLISTAAYGTVFARDWWRQSSNSTQRPNDAADPACGGMANLHTTCGNEGRLRDYFTWGVESKARASFALGTLRNQADFGLRWHFEDQGRRQANGPLPTSRSGVVVENNERTTRAFSFYAQNSFLFGAWKLTPGVRVEKIAYRRVNRLANGGSGVRGTADRAFAVPGFGVSYSPASHFTFFAGVHRGFAPSRVEDIINNNTGASIELDPELSWNYEAGVRTRFRPDLRLEATFFRMDFSNQVVPASVAGGVGATLTNGGKTLHQGMELSGQYDWRNAAGSGNSIFLRAAHTWLPTARFQGARFSTVPGFAATLVTRNRLPYAAQHLLTAAAGFRHRRGFNAHLELVYTGRQFADDLNTIIGSADGQRGLLPGNAIWNMSVNYPVEAVRSTFFVTVKNLLDRTVIVDRSRGILPGIPRMIQGGLQWNF